MGSRGSADPTHDGRDGLPPVRDFSPRRRHRQHAEASRGHGHIQFSLQVPGPHTMPGRTGARFRTPHAPALRAVCDALHADGNSATRSTTPRHVPPTCPPLPTASGQDRAVDIASSRRILRGRASSGGPEGLRSARFREADGGSRRAAEDHTFTHFFARLLFRIASHSRTSWWPSSAVAKSTGVPRPLAMCS